MLMLVGCQQEKNPNHQPILTVATEQSENKRALAEEVAARQELAEIFLGDAAAPVLEPSTDGTVAAPPEVDPARLAAANLRSREGKYIKVITDLPEGLEADQLTEVFDMAVPLWADYFAVGLDVLDKWQVTACVIRSKERFENAGLIPADLPSFENGYQRGYWLWINDQPSDYYRRHLLLHEGVHAFMQSVLGGTGPPWYREGMAELLATHRLSGNNLIVGYMPRAKAEVPHWGRIKLLQDEFRNNRAKMLVEVMELRADEAFNVKSYAWCWAATAFLDGHPSYRYKFRRMRSDVREQSGAFSSYLRRQFAGQLREMDEQWQLFIADIDFGYDFQRNAVEYGPGSELPTGGKLVKIAADRGWQSTGVRLEAGQRYELSAEGQIQIAQRPEVWVSEANGITLKYHAGLPLGLLVGNVRLDKPRPGMANLGRPIPVGIGTTVTPAASGTLYLKVNDSAAALADNAGEYLVRIHRFQADPSAMERQRDERSAADRPGERYNRPMSDGNPPRNEPDAVGRRGSG